MHNGAYGTVNHKIHCKVHWQFVAHISTCHTAQLPDTVSFSAADCVIAADRAGCSSFVWTIRPWRPGMEMFLSLTIHQSRPDNRMGLGKSAGILLRQVGTRGPLPAFKCLLFQDIPAAGYCTKMIGPTVESIFTTFHCPFYISKVDFYIFRRKYEWCLPVEILGCCVWLPGCC